MPIENFQNKKISIWRRIVMHATRKRKAKKKNNLLNCPVERRSTIWNFGLFHSSFVGFLVQTFSVCAHMLFFFFFFFFL